MCCEIKELFSTLYRRGMPERKFFPGFPPNEEEKYMIKSMVIKKSKVPNAGRGVFSKIFIPKGKLIGWYRGEIINFKKASDTDYVLTLHDGTSICGKNHGNFTSLINCPTGTPFHANTEFTNDGTLVCIKDIYPDEELFIDYGKDYWTGRPDMLYSIMQSNKPKEKKTRKVKKH